MFSPLKTFKSTIFLLIGFCTISTFSTAQESADYFRYFEVKLEQSVDLEQRVNANLFRETPFSIHSTCSSRQTVIVAVSADYPKRVLQIEEELRITLKDIISTEKIKSVQTVKVSNLETLCP